MDGYKYELAQQNRIYNSLKIYFLYFQIKKMKDILIEKFKYHLYKSCIHQI